MANAFNELMADVNQTIAEMNKATSAANGAAATAQSAANRASTSAGNADAAAQLAQTAAAAAGGEAEKWAGVTVEATTLGAGSDATIAVTEKNGVKHLIFGIPEGVRGADGQKGDTGKSGVTFTRTGTSLYIDTV